MSELHTCLWSDVAAFDFDAGDFAPLARAFPQIQIVNHRDADAFLARAASADWLLTWDFERDWYRRCTSLKAIFTPAAGNDWVAADPDGKVAILHGTFHGPLLAESLLAAMLFMNHRMPDMLRNFRRRGWDRNLQAGCRLLRHQTVVIVGLGHIGTACARAIAALGARVIGVKRDPGRLTAPLEGVEVRGAGDLATALAEADHLVLLLPGDESTDGFLSAADLQRCKPGVFVYNFGRGNALRTHDVLAAADHIGGAFLDVVDQEPLPPDSPLWQLPNVMITPHSSCIYTEYKAAFIDEVIARGGELFA